MNIDDEYVVIDSDKSRTITIDNNIDDLPDLIPKDVLGELDTTCESTTQDIIEQTTQDIIKQTTQDIIEITMQDIIEKTMQDIIKTPIQIKEIINPLNKTEPIESNKTSYIWIPSIMIISIIIAIFINKT